METTKKIIEILGQLDIQMLKPKNDGTDRFDYSIKNSDEIIGKLLALIDSKKCSTK